MLHQGTQLHVLEGLRLPRFQRIKEGDRPFGGNLLIKESHIIRHSLSAVLLKEPVDLLEVGGGDLFNGLTDLDAGLELAVFLHRHQLVNAAENRVALGSDQVLAHAEGVDDRTL